mmetsp:Transcript_15267/g.36012  ORF Transcript_15267/g.36012 Transcript_15267/m.36012 type:complete len:843 (+) Transcript_15267:67-2595(+)|eukprot:CAMPEP_0114563512 /NCGR_PEP_ID=MMETSP0114-20121206/13154_1 /TAXON_ID=31324 /ORGANISM="Goniomonas sp, Strain m" /LENGTH=842 /DNA_ID=CAMNT_0001749373 /DNA_START=36 /DNA_END=2564 /DNA_ORIENTATION=+
MDQFCGRPSELWGPLGKHYLTYCFDDLLLFGASYVFMFVFGSWRVWTLRKKPVKPDFPYSTRHSVKVMLLGWLGLLPVLIFAIKYANTAHDDFEWVAKPLSSLAWFYSLWIMNLETARDMKECWVLRTFWIVSALIGIVALPTVILHGEHHGYGFGFYSYLVQFLLYITMAVAAIKYSHQGQRVLPGQRAEAPEAPPPDAPLTLLSSLWWEYTWRLFSLFAPEKYLCALGLLCASLSAPLSALALVIVGRLFNNCYYPYSSLSAQSHLRDYCLALIVIYTVTCFLDALFTMALFISGERMAARTRRRVFHSVLRQETAFFDEVKTQQIAATLKTDILTVQRAMTEQFGHGMSCIITIVVSVTIQMFVSWKMTLLTLSVGPICVLAVVLQKHFSADLKAQKGTRLARAGTSAREVLVNIRLVRSFGGEEQAGDRYGQSVQAVYDLALRSGLLDAGSKSLVSLMFQLAISLSLYVGGILVLSHQLEVGYMVTLFALVIIMVSSAAQLPDLVTQFQRALVASESVFRLLDRVPNIFPKGGQVLENLDGHLSFSDICFTYPSAPQNPVFRDLSLEVLPGRTALVVGPRGSGKTTLIALAQRMYDVQSGTIMLDGRDVRALDMTWLREQMCLVPQDPVVFSVTIANNIGYGADGMSQATVEKAARISGAHDWIQSLTDGYQALVGERGVRLTAAQKVQLALARALAMAPQTLILDDCLGALDPDTQKTVISGVERQMSRNTLLFFSSRPDLPVHADSFWLLGGGKATSYKTRQELAAAPSLSLLASRGESAPEGDVGLRGALVLKQMEQVLLQQPVERDKAMDLLDLVTNIKEAMFLERVGDSSGLD